MARKRLQSYAVDKRPKSQSGWTKNKPATQGAREKLMGKCGQVCFLLPTGTPARPNVPAYPICVDLTRSKGRCVVSCPGLEAAFKRLRMGIAHYKYPAGYIANLRALSNHAIKLAREHADPSDPTNTCNWALRAKYAFAGYTGDYTFDGVHCRDAERKFVPVPQCTHRFKLPTTKKRKPAKRRAKKR